MKKPEINDIINNRVSLVHCGPLSPEGGEGMRSYEFVYVLKPEVEEEKRNGLLERFKSIIGQKGEVTNVDEWGMRRLAYPIKKFNEGYYVFLEFNGERDIPSELETTCRVTDEILRYLIVKKGE
ncbi:SSU ribosomal protein S6P [Caldanaerobius fijiensis DSM 17918]|uniref:Small ribosomal subunit protein bS6 n=2 Tax=Caldanaerobius TaxID=862261 RepID=A0A1M5ARK2_9THEO|nr:SSU ribosomal protein S6P [Caldanaerobius fijiensis DSM 17918]